jgi:hypothetical protein
MAAHGYTLLDMARAIMNAGRYRIASVGRMTLGWSYEKREKQFDFSDVTSILLLIFACFMLGNIWPINFFGE